MCSPGYAETCSIDQGSFELRDLLLCTSLVLGLRLCATTLLLSDACNRPGQGASQSPDNLFTGARAASVLTTSEAIGRGRASHQAPALQATHRRVVIWHWSCSSRSRRSLQASGPRLLSCNLEQKVAREGRQETKKAGQHGVFPWGVPPPPQPASCHPYIARPLLLKPPQPMPSPSHSAMVCYVKGHGLEVCSYCGKGEPLREEARFEDQVV